MSKITIHKPQLYDENGRTVLKFFISAKDDNNIEKGGELWFSFAQRYRTYVCDEVCDGVAVMLLRCCLIGGYDIESEIPMTERLYYDINNHFIPQMVLLNPSTHRVKLIMKTICPDWHPTAVATAMSCGIDSLATYYEYTGIHVPENYRITHLTFFEQGAHHGGGGKTWEEQNSIFQAQLARVEYFCKTVNSELIDIQSNIDGIGGFLSTVLFHEYYQNTHTYRNIGFALLLQKLIKIYYYASAYNLDEFSCSLYTSSAHYEKYMLPTLSTDYTSFFSANSTLTRLEKIKWLSTIPETYDKVLVCYKGGSNCGTCIKCWRTMLEMEVLGVLDLYKSSFNIAAFRDNYELYLTKMLLRRQSDPIMEAIYQYMIEHGISIPKKCFQEARRIEKQQAWKKSMIHRLLGKIKKLIIH